MKDPIRVLVILLLISLIAFIDMCNTTQQQRDFDKHNTRPDTMKRNRVKIKIC
jgi:hypothetical protein